MQSTKQKMIAAVFACGLAPLASLHAATIASVETNTSGTAGLTIDQNPVITAIGSQPGTLDGYTYSNYALITQDATASLEVFGKLPTTTAHNSYLANGNLPAVGDSLTATGSYAPFDSIPELASLTDIQQVSDGNPTPTPQSVSAATLANAANDTPGTYLGYYLELTNVVFGQTGVFPTHANGTYTVTDVGGTTPLTVFQWASSYSAAGALGGTPIPVVPSDIYGIVSIFNGSPEFVPFSIVQLPEPTSITLLGLGAAGLLGRRRKAR